MILSLSYGKARRLEGQLTAFTTDANPARLPGWQTCYGTRHTTAAILTISLEKAAC